MPQTTNFIAPVESDKIQFAAMTGREAISESFEYQVDFMSRTHELKAGAFLGKRGTVETALRNDGDEKAYFDGIITRLAFVGMKGRLFHFQATLRPSFWLLSKTVDCRIFQNLTPIEIAQTIFSSAPLPVRANMSGVAKSYEPIAYCVQYRESDYDFICRLFQEHGIAFHFIHDKEGHELVVWDEDGYQQSTPNEPEKIPYMAQTDATRKDRQVIKTWQMASSYVTCLTDTKDYDYLRPHAALTSGAVMSDAKNGALEQSQFLYPAGFSAEMDLSNFAKLRNAEAMAAGIHLGGTTNAPYVRAGGFFELVGGPITGQETKHCVLATSIEIMEPNYEGLGGEKPARAAQNYGCTFTALGIEEFPFPAPKLQRPNMTGPQTATVVNEDGGEDDVIHTDEHGRVRVRFHWDRYFKGDGPRDHKANQSAYLRVSSSWAGRQYGFIALPRAGHEVIVDFLDGDVDQPIITGRVYNADMIPPWDLPKHKTRSGYVSRTPTKDPTNANEFRLEDREGEEQVFLHAQRNLDVEVEQRETRKVGASQYVQVAADAQFSCGGKRTASIGKDDSTTISGKRTTMVALDQGNTVGGNSKFVTLGDHEAAAHSIKVDAVTSYKLTSVTHNATATASYKVTTVAYELNAAATIRIGATSITQSGTATQTVTGGAKLALGSQALVEITAPIIKLAAGPSSIELTPAGITMKGPMISATAAATITLLGAIVKMNT
jgi:type VI secretion system secreted protein VgrG